MLADQVASWCDGWGAKVLGEGARRLQKDIYEATRFSLAPGLMRSTEAITNAPIKQRLEVMRLSKLPFRKSWFEWEGSFRNNIGGCDPSNTPTRIGALVDVDETHQRGIATWMWSFEGVGIDLCLASASFDWSGTAVEVPSVCIPPSQEQAILVAEEGDKKFFKQASREDFIDYFGRFGFGPSPYWIDIMAKACKNYPDGDPPGFREAWEASLRNLKGEPETLLAAIVLLNSKNLTKTSDVAIDPSVNKRRRRVGRPPLLSYRAVKVDLSRSLSRRASTGDGPSSRAHIVRGHFKIRKGGIFWWSPFVRGDASIGLVGRTSYAVSR